MDDNGDDYDEEYDDADRNDDGCGSKKWSRSDTADGTWSVDTDGRW